MLRVELDSQKRNKLVKKEPIRPCRFEAKTVSPNNMPSRMRKKIYRIKFKFISSIALGRK